ncbi:DNA polymerase III subunit delta' [Thiohalospira sp.]|uniref:DNA polymerase III subunit delta' n=1 Tax=Thiohalospira sp. TaxID=3080549 RepID=UPI00398084BF
MTAPLPWQAEAWERLSRARRVGRLPHALLFTGPEGMGKGHLARALVAAILCEADGDTACGECRSCQLRLADSHPDRLVLQPEKEGGAIGVEAVREAIAFLQRHAHYGVGRCILVEPAEALTTSAANSLLKTLEEPTAGSLLTLVASRPGRLPATVVSRCQQVHLAPVATDDATSRDWLDRNLGPGHDAAKLLALAAGAPLRARDRASEAATVDFAEWQALATGEADPVTVAGRWQREPATALTAVVAWTEDLLRLAAGAGEALRQPDHQAALQRLAEGVDWRRLLEFHATAVSTLDGLTRRNLNAELALEGVLVAWTEATRRPRR